MPGMRLVSTWGEQEAMEDRMSVMSQHLIYIVIATLLVVTGTDDATAQAPGPPAPRAQEAPAGGGDDAENGDDNDDRQPYDELITDEAISDEGVFTVHRIDEDVYYEIPESELGREFLWVARIARTVVGQGYGGERLDTRVVRWERRGDRVFLRNVSYEVVADNGLPIARAVEAANNDTILMAFDVEARGEDGAVVIDVTPLFATEVTELSARTRLQARGFDERRSYVDRVLTFPENIEVRAVHTYTRPPDAGGTGGARGNQRGMPPGSATLELAYSMVKLPEDPMLPRLYDDRVGFFSVSQTDFGVDEHRAPDRRYITRWRLEKQDPEAEVSDPVRPIEYWIDPATPTQWVPFVRQGIEDWQVAFEAAGFSNAIVARDAPSPEEDQDWSPEDARYSVIRWLPSDTENAFGPHVHDPRTGEILEADIQLHHNVQNLLRDWYFVQVGPLDPRAARLPLPDELMGRLIQFVVAHEVGHTLGFQHNMKASSTYPVDRVRDPAWVRTMGHTPTLMDYARFNYVAQPEDGIPVEDLVPKIGPYDIWATRWGYMPISGAAVPDDEVETLNAWALEQDDTPWYRFSTAGSGGTDPGELTEAVGDANAVEATRLGVQNLERVMDLLLEATTYPGENWDDLEELYGRLLGQWVREMNHVGALVGGFNSRQLHGGADGVRFMPVSGDTQRNAVAFLVDNAFETPTFLIRPEILRRIEPSGVLARIRNSQRSVLNFLLNDSRFTRLVEQRTLDDTAYGPGEFLNDLRQGIWAELDAPSVSTDAFRRNLQRVYLDLVGLRLNGEDAQWDDLGAFLRGQLRTLDGGVASAQERAVDDVTRYHLADVRDQIAALLDSEDRRADLVSDAADGLAPDPFNPYTVLGCWVDARIEP